MEIKSYNDIYLNDVCENIGSMVEYASESGIDINTVWISFINSDIAKEIENGNPKYLNGISGKELLCYYLDIKIVNSLNSLLQFNEFYWAGYVVARLQFETSLTFKFINKYLPFCEVLKMYHPFHEADPLKFVEVARDIINQRKKDTNLKIIRERCGYSQHKLADASGIDYRSIQMYEQRRNDINKAQAITLFKISKVLGCSINDLLEL